MDEEKEREEQFLAMQNQFQETALRNKKLEVKIKDLELTKKNYEIALKEICKENKMIELFLTDVKFHLSAEKSPKFTFKGLVEELEYSDKILKEIKADPKECKLRVFIKLPEN